MSYPARPAVLTNLSLNLDRRVATAQGVTAQDARGAVIGVMGESGCGKSTLLNVFSGAVREGLVPTGSEDPVHLTGSVTGLGTTLVIPQSPVFTAPTVQTEMALYALSATEAERERAAALLGEAMDSKKLSVTDAESLNPVPSVLVRRAASPWHVPWLVPRLSTVPAVSRPC